MAFFGNRERLAKLMAMFAVSLFLLGGCGQKGNPTMRSFEKPQPVTGMQAVHRDGKITISWTYAKQAKIAVKGFYVERATGKSPFETVSFLNGDATGYVDDHFDVGKEYRYRIRVYSLRNIISDESPELKVTPVALPDPPADLAYRLTDDAVEITWNKVADGVMYNVYRGTGKEICSAALLNAEPIEKPSFKTAVNTGQPAFYSVRSVVRTDITNEGRPSECLEVNPQTFVPAGPSDVRFVRTENRLYLSWKDNPETWTKGYRIYRKRGGGPFMPLAEVQVPLYVDEEPVKVPTSYYITALGPVKESSPSPTVSVNP